MAFNVTILGANSAIPTGNRLPSSQILEFNQHRYLMDCGEGTQIQLRKNKVKLQSIKVIFISHLHGDHYFGIFGLLGTMNLLGRTSPLRIFSPPGLKEIIYLQQKAARSAYVFDIEFTELERGPSKAIYDDGVIEVWTIPLNHRIQTNGFLFKEKLGKRKLSQWQIEELEIPISKLNGIKEGADFIDPDGRVYKNAQITQPPNKAWTYAYCSDTRYDPRIVPIIANADVLYHEATFHDAEQERAKQTMHSTTKEAAEIAKMANVGELIIGHFSARYKTLDTHLEETQSVFENAHLAIEGKCFSYK